MKKKGLRKPQERLLKEYFNSLSVTRSTMFSWSFLPENLIVKLEKVFDSETLWCDSERFLNDLKCKYLQERTHKELQSLFGCIIG